MFITSIHHSQGEWRGGGGVLIIQFIRVGKILNYLRPSIWDLVHNSVRQSFKNSELKSLNFLMKELYLYIFFGWVGGGW